MEYFVGVDVGTTSARAGVVDQTGHIVAVSMHPITLFNEEPDYFEYSSDDIWNAVCTAVRDAVNKSGVPKLLIKGLGFDATCSLVVLGENDTAVSVGKHQIQNRNVIAWLDHRAISQSSRINSLRNSNKAVEEVLKYVGGKISPEMQSPKLLWLKENVPDSFAKATKFFDLADFLSYKSTEVDDRSLCTTVCKWTFLAHKQISGRQGRKYNSGNSLSQYSSAIGNGGWVDDYWKAIGISEFVHEKYARIGENHKIRNLGDSVANGLTNTAAEQMGMQEGTAVAVGMIDAHAGGIGVLGSVLNDGEINFHDRLAILCGTSACHMAVSQNPLFIEGLWGPYYSAMIPELWLSEGGQSAAGSLIDHIINSNTNIDALKNEAKTLNKNIFELLNEKLKQLGTKRNEGWNCLSKEVHILPYFHGNRSPRADPTLKGIIVGLTLSNTIDNLLIQYLAALQAIAYGTRHIIEELNNHGYDIKLIFLSGGWAKNEVFVSELADITHCNIVLSKEGDAMIVGSAILGAKAANRFPSVIEGMKEMCKSGKIIAPSHSNSPSHLIWQYHEAKYKVFHQLHTDFMNYRRIMSTIAQ